VLIAWLVVGVVLLLIELQHLAFYALFVAIGCFAAAATAAIAPSAVGVQAAVAMAVSGVGVVAVRPMVSRVFEGRHLGHGVHGVHGGLVGQQALTLDDVGDGRSIGHVRLAGEKWLAVSGDGDAIPPNTTVLVTAVRGTTLIVWPVGEIGKIEPNGSVT